MLTNVKFLSGPEIHINPMLKSRARNPCRYYRTQAAKVKIMMNLVGRKI